MQTINKNDKFVACWGYDQTQYSIYNVVGVKGKSVLVEGLNSWSNLGESDLAVGSEVKVYEFKHWEMLPKEEREDLASRGFNWSSYNHHYGKDAELAAKVSKITSMKRIDGKSWSYIWTLDDGRTVSSEDSYKNGIKIKIVRGIKKCLVNEKYGNPSIRIDQCITASLDKEYDKRKQAYADQNEYTSYNGR